MALSSLNKAFNSDDFPAFGLPIIAVFIPSFNIFPLLNVSFRLSNLFFVFSKIPNALLFVTSSISYSG